MQMINASQDNFALIGHEPETTIERKMQEMFPKNAGKIDNVPYFIEPSKQ